LGCAAGDPLTRILVTFLHGSPKQCDARHEHPDRRFPDFHPCSTSGAARAATEDLVIANGWSGISMSTPIPLFQIWYDGLMNRGSKVFVDTVIITPTLCDKGMTPRGGTKFIFGLLGALLKV
jgi:hypothetical protein